MELEVYNISGKKTSKKAKLDDNVFSIEPNDHSIYMDVRLYRNNQRQGTSKAKGRSEVVGSTRKIKKQKGGAYEINKTEFETAIDNLISDLIVLALDNKIVLIWSFFIT